MAVDAELFREIFNSFPTSVSVITTLDAEGNPRGFTCKAMSAVSIDPPLLLICVDKSSRTVRAIEASGAFVVNVLAEGGQQASQVFAGKSAHKFTDVDWIPSRAANGCPVLTGITLAHVECIVTQSVEAGDHWIIIGRLENAEVFQRRPLLYHRKAYDVWKHAPGHLPASAR